MYDRNALENLRKYMVSSSGYRNKKQPPPRDSTVLLLEDKIKHGHIRTRKDVLEYLGISDPDIPPTYDGSA